MIQWSYKMARRLVVALVGASVLLVGIVMIVVPGPAFIVIPVGLAILSIEFAWARYWLKKLRSALSNHGANNRGQRAEAHRSRVAAPLPTARDVD